MFLWNDNKSSREISIQGEGDGTACAVFNQLWAWLFTNCEKIFPINQQPILQLVDDCTSGIETFPLYRDFPGLAVESLKKKYASFIFSH